MSLEGFAPAMEGDINLGDRRSRWQASHLASATHELLERDSASFLHQSLSTPCLNALQGAEGSWLIDVEGRRYLDFHGNSVHQVGYGHPSVVNAIKNQLDRLSFCPRRYTNEPAIELAEKLAQITPGKLSKSLFVPGGTEAVGLALKLARWATGRYKTVSMWDSFHGASLDAISIGGEELFRRGIGPLMPGTEHVSPPDPTRCPLGCGNRCSLACASYLEYVLEKEGDIAAVIAEPIRATTAVLPPPGYWKRIREACDRTGTLLIFDEIPVGLGRSGHMFATEWTGIVPDILVLGKGLGGGIWPLAAVVAHEDLDCAQEVALGHYTHEKNPVAAAAALATIAVIETEGLVARSQLLGERFKEALQRVASRHSVITDIRAHGLLAAVEVADPATAERVMYESLSRGLSFKVSAGTVLTLTPPLTVSDSELDSCVAILDSAFSVTHSKP